MAKKKAAPGASKIDQTARLLTRIGVTQGRSMLEKLWPEARIIRRGTDVLRMTCPVHDDNTPSFDLDFHTGSMFCFGCKFATTSVFRLLQETKGYSYAQSIEMVRAYVDLRAIAETTLKELTAQDHYDNAMRILAEVFNEHMRNLIAGTKSSVYTVAVHDGASLTLRWLFDDRRRDKDVAPYMPYGITPTPIVFDHLLAEVMEREVERKMRQKKSYPDKEWRLAVKQKAEEIYKTIDGGYYHSVAYFTGSDFTTFRRVKLRRPADDKTQNVVVLAGMPGDNDYGYFGLASLNPRFQGKLEADHLFTVVVEGENDALALAEHAFREGKHGYLILASGGSANELDALEECGVRRVHLLSDVEHKGGTDYIVQKLATAREVDVRVFGAWNEVARDYPTVKDPDELVQAAGSDVAFEALIRRSDRYVPHTDWVARKILEDLAGLPRDDRSVRAQLAVVRGYGACVRHPANVTELVKQLQVTGLPEGDLRRELLSVRDNSEAAFKLAILSKLREEFHPLFFSGTGTRPMLRAFHKTKRRMVDIFLTDPESTVMAMARMHGSVYEYMRDQVGIPAFLGAGDDAPNTTPERALTPHLNSYLKFALQEFVRGVPTRAECEEYGQGMHMVTDPSTGEVTQIVNNGTRVYRGAYLTPGSVTMEWEELPGPAEDALLFRTAKRPWSKEIKQADDLLDGNGITKDVLKKEIETLVDVITQGWVFAQPGVMPTFVAWDCAAKVLGYCTPRKTILHATGDSHSGKSTLMSLYSGKDAPFLRVVEASVNIDNFTEASLFQMLHRSSLLACVDEFEDTRDNLRQSNEIQAAIRLMRGVLNETPVPVHRGTIDGMPVEYSVQTNFLLASILRAHDVQDDNRRFEIDMRHVAGRGDTAQIILQRFSPSDFNRIRRNFTVGLPKFAREYVERCRHIEMELTKSNDLPFQVPQRFVQASLPVLALMSLFGEDYKTFFNKLCESKRVKLTATQNDTKGMVLYERILRTPCIRSSDNDNRALRVTDLLRTSDEISALNRARCGVMIMEKNGLMVLEHVTAQGRGGVYEHWTEYRSMTHRNLKHTLDQHPGAVRTEDYDKFNVSAFVRNNGGAYNPLTISVLHIDSLMRELREYAPLGEAAPAASPEVQTQAAANDGSTTPGRNPSGGSDNLL